MLREEGAKRRGKFFARPVSGPGQRVQVIRQETGTKGPKTAADGREESTLACAVMCLARPTKAGFFDRHSAD